MSERQIEVGDMVMVVRGHKCVIDALGGIPLTVAEIDPDADVGCHLCGIAVIATGAVAMLCHMHCDYRIPVAWLKRIPPLETPEREESEVAA